MATELVTETWCDKHLVDNDGEKVRATVSAAVSLNGTAYTLDLCEECEPELTALSDWLDSYGQPADGEPRAPRAATVEAAGKVRCQVCQRSYSNLGSLRAHYRQSHEMNAVQYAKYLPADPTGRPRADPQTCADCGFIAANGTGLAAHRRGTHPAGVKH